MHALPTLYLTAIADFVPYGPTRTDSMMSLIASGVSLALWCLTPRCAPFCRFLATLSSMLFCVSPLNKWSISKHGGLSHRWSKSSLSLSDLHPCFSLHASLCARIVLSLYLTRPYPSLSTPFVQTRQGVAIVGS